MTKQRSIVEVIDEMLAVIPADQDEFIGALEILVQSINASSKQKNLRKGIEEAHWDHWEWLGNICEVFIGEPSESWHFNLASVYLGKPFPVLLKHVLKE